MLFHRVLCLRHAHHHQIALVCLQKSQANAASSAPSNSVLQEMSQLVDAALSQAPATSRSPAACEAVALPITTQDPCPTHHYDCNAAGYAAVDNRAKGKGTVGTKGPDGLSSSQSTKSIGSKKVNRPAWALTAGAAQDAEQQEEEDLLAFAGGLEFDEYINEQEDAELRTALQVLLIVLLWGSVTLAQASVDSSSCAMSPCQQQFCTTANSLASMLQPAKHTNCTLEPAALG